MNRFRLQNFALPLLLLDMPLSLAEGVAFNGTSDITLNVKNGSKFELRLL